MHPKYRDLLPIALLCAMTGVLAFSFRRYAVDDAFITYRYALNLAKGHGFTYNPGEDVLSTTAPLYGMLLAGLSRLGANLPNASNLIGVLSLGGTAVLVYLLCARRNQQLAGLIASLALLLSPGLLRTLGLETNLSLLLILAGVYLYTTGRVALSGAPLALALLVRPDAIVVEALLLGHHLLARRRLPWRQMALFAVLALPFVVYLIAVFGSPLPVTLRAKQAQLQGNWASYLGGLRPWLHAYFGTWGLAWVALLAALAGLPVVLLRHRWALLILVWAAAYAAAYQVLGIAAYDWYYAPLVPAFALLAGLGTAAIGRWVGRLVHLQPSTAALGLVVAMPFLYAQGASTIDARESLPEAKAEVYRQAGEWLERETSSDATVGVMEVGIMGYYARRPMIDFLGLIRPETIVPLKRGDIFWSIARYQPDYVVLTGVNPLWMYSVESNQWFRESYAAVRSFSNAGFWGSPLTVFRRVTPRLPEPDMQRSGLIFGDKLALVSYSLVPQVQAGQFVALDMRWKATGAVDNTFAISVHLTNNESRLLSQWDTGVPVGVWRAGEEQDYRIILKVPSAAPAGLYGIRVIVHSPEIRKTWPVRGKNGESGEFAVLASIGVAPPAGPQGDTPIASFNKLALTGYTLGKTRATFGETLPVTLRWQGQVDSPVETRVRLLSGGNQVTAEAKARLPQDASEQQLSLTLPQSLAPERNRIEVAVFDVATGAELAPVGPFGLPPLGGRLIIDEINVD